MRKAREHGRSRPEARRSRKEWKGRQKEAKGAEESGRGSEEDEIVASGRAKRREISQQKSSGK